MAKEKTEVAVKQDTAVATVGQGAWGSEGVDKSDFLIPKILLMQGLSKFVADEKAQMGDFVNSVTGEVIAGRGKPIEIIPLISFKTWIKFEETSQGKWEYRGQEPMTAANAHWELDGEENGLKVRRDRALNFYVLLASEADRPDALPLLISCRRTSYMAGKKLVTYFGQCQMANQPPAAHSLPLEGKKVQNDKGTFYVLDVDAAKKKRVSEKQLAKAYEWYQTLKKGGVKVDDSDLTEASTETVDVSVDVEFGKVTEASQF